MLCHTCNLLPCTPFMDQFPLAFWGSQPMTQQLLCTLQMRPQLWVSHDRGLKAGGLCSS